MELFGFTLTRNDEKEQQEKNVSFVPENLDDGSLEIAAGGAYGSYVDLEGSSNNEGELIGRYREMSVTPECDAAIQDIVNESIITSEDGDILELDVTKMSYPETVKNKIQKEFDNILELLNFNSKAYDYFRKWYVDGRIYFHIVIDIKNPKAGIQELRFIDPRRIKKVKESIKKKDPRSGAIIHVGTNEYYVYNQKGAYGNKTAMSGSTTEGLKISKDSIAFCHSGIVDGKTSLIYSHLHKAMKTLNQLRMLEDSVVIYRLARAPERRIFYIDVGNLPKMKAEQYLRDMQAKWKNKLVYDASTGAVRDDRKFMTMLEDFWLPRREGGRGTEITTLPGGQNLGEMDDVEYFRRKLYKALNVPVSRLESENAFNLGRAQEITRDEVKFSKFVDRLRAQFSNLFNDLLEIQLSLKGIMNRSEWNKAKQEVIYDFQNDNHYQELKEAEIQRDRFSLLNEIDPFVGKYVSTTWVRKNILRFSDEDIKEMESDLLDDQKDMEDQEEQEPPPAPTPVTVVDPPKNEELVNDEEKALVESMTRFMDSMTEEK
jgi:hypothetical protein